MADAVDRGTVEKVVADWICGHGLSRYKADLAARELAESGYFRDPAVEAELERQRDLVAEFRKREESQDRIRIRLTGERDRLRDGIAELCADGFLANLIGDEPEWVIRSSDLRSLLADDTGSAAGVEGRAVTIKSGTPEAKVCEDGCGCRYGTDDPDRRDCGCLGPCTTALTATWGCLGRHDANCGGDCPKCPSESGAPKEGGDSHE